MFFEKLWLWTSIVSFLYVPNKYNSHTHLGSNMVLLESGTVVGCRDFYWIKGLLFSFGNNITSPSHLLKKLRNNLEIWIWRICIKVTPTIGLSKNTKWPMYPRFWTTFIAILFFAWLLILSVSACTPVIAWTIVDLSHSSYAPSNFY